MALYPEVQKRAQEHIEQFAPNRLPTHDDYNSLPYIKSLLKELTRWAPVAPLGLPHRVIQDDVYEHYFIPKGATIIGNIG
jgi:cytochrome P450